MKKLVFYTLLSFSILLKVLYWTDGLFIRLFEEILTNLHVIVALSGTLSFALFSYTDGIMKDFVALKAKTTPNKFDKTVQSLNRLRKEIIENVAIIFLCYLTERFFNGLFVIAEENYNNSLLIWAILSIRFTCLIVIIIASYEQWSGFIISIKYRDIMAQNT